MIFTRDFFAFLTCTAMPMLCHCKAVPCPTERPPPPTGLSYKWLDPFTVTMFWQKPSELKDCEVKYCLKNAKEKDVKGSILANVTVNCLTEKIPKGSDYWTYKVWTVCSHSSNCSNKGNPAFVKIQSRKPRAEVKDMKCVTDSKEMNCSWIPGSQSFNLSYRICGVSEKHINNLKACDQPYSSAMRSGCYLKAAYVDDICIVMDSGDNSSTFEAAPVRRPPKLIIREEGDNLKLSWEKFGSACMWAYEICHKKCNNAENCENFNKQGESMKVPYDKSCRHEFRFRVNSSRNCPTAFSDFSNVVAYGTNKPRDETLTVVTIVIPIILCVCIILSCYCFRRHSAIICPIIPDPSAIFKEMMMNGNKELKTTVGSLYMPVPEPIEPCKIALVTENSVLQQNS